MKKAIYIHCSSDRKRLVNILMEPWPEKGLSDKEIEEETLALRLWMGEYLPGTVFDKVFEREGLEEIPGRIDIPIKRMENLSEIQKGNFSASIILPPPLPVKDEAKNIVSLKDNPAPMRLRIEIGKKESEAEGERGQDLLFRTADSLMRYYAEVGSKAFRSRFGSLDILGPAKKIIEEGEGNPHPWD